MKHHYTSWKIVLLSCLFFNSNSYASVAEPQIKVLIGKSLNKIIVEGKKIKRFLSGADKTKEFEGLKTFSFNCNKIKLAKDSKSKKPVLLSKVSSATGIIKWNEIPYRGDLILVTADDYSSCNLINQVSLEKYLSSLLSKEMKSTWPIEALKAQAIAARTYAYHKIKENQSRNGEEEFMFDIENSERHQVTGTFLDETLETEKAVKETKGVVLMNSKNELRPVFYHSKCGGKTVGPSLVWGSSNESHVSVKCPFCNGHGNSSWSYKLTEKEFVEVYKKIKKEMGQSTVVAADKLILVPDALGRPKVKIYEGDQLNFIKRSSFRKAMGRVGLPSNNFVVHKSANEYYFVGKGNGHGVGMCQYGAMEMAKRGMTYKQIISYYFPNHKFVKIY